MTLHKYVKVEKDVSLPIEKVWELWTVERHITQWNHASDDWHSPSAHNDLREGGHFSYRMEAKDGSFGFDFSGTYTIVKPYELIEYRLDDSRMVRISFVSEFEKTHITEVFEAELENTTELQQKGWQSILDKFKNYAERVA